MVDIAPLAPIVEPPLSPPEKPPDIIVTKPAIRSAPPSRPAHRAPADKPRHWTKRAMIAVTIAWPIVTFGLAGWSFVAAYAGARKMANGWYIVDNLPLDPDAMFSMALTSAFMWGSLTTTAYFVAIATLGVLWFATKAD